MKLIMMPQITEIVLHILSIMVTEDITICHLDLLIIDPMIITFRLLTISSVLIHGIISLLLLITQEENTLHLSI